MIDASFCWCSLGTYLIEKENSWLATTVLNIGLFGSLSSMWGLLTGGFWFCSSVCPSATIGFHCGAPPLSIACFRVPVAKFHRSPIFQYARRFRSPTRATIDDGGSVLSAYSSTITLSS